MKRPTSKKTVPARLSHAAPAEHAKTDGASVTPGLTHVDRAGHARMVNVGAKHVTARRAVAESYVLVTPDAFEAFRSGSGPKGDVASTARIAGVMAAKRAPELIPLCHPLKLDAVAVEVEAAGTLPATLARLVALAGEEAGAPVAPRRGIRVRATVEAHDRTGVEMEALTAASVAALTVYDMLKAIDKTMVIAGTRLVEKSGGRSGNFRAKPL